MRRILWLVFAMAAALGAADASGKWSGNVTAPGGELTTAYFELRQSGEDLSGTAGPSAGRQFPIRKARIQGSKLTFEVAMPDGATMKFGLVLEAERMQGEMTREKSGEGEETSRILVRRAA